MQARASIAMLVGACLSITISCLRVCVYVCGPLGQELEENVEYVEKEDEFDVVVDARNPEGQKRKTAAEQQQEEDEEKLTVSIDAIDTVGRGEREREQPPRERAAARLCVCV